MSNEEVKCALLLLGFRESVVDRKAFTHDWCMDRAEGENVLWFKNKDRYSYTAIEDLGYGRYTSKDVHLMLERL